MLVSGEISSRELVELCLRRIDASQPTLNAFRVVCEEARSRKPTAADKRLAKGDGAPLLGVPIAIKDDVDLAGHTTPFGCGGSHSPPRRTAEVVRRLRAAGAIVIGKTHAPEVGQWPFTESAYLRRHAQPLAHRPHARRLERRRRSAVAAGLVAARDRLRRRRLGPHPRRLDRPGRLEAPARADLDLAGARGLQRPHLLRAADQERRRRGPAARRGGAAIAMATCTGRLPTPRASRRRPRSRRGACGSPSPSRRRSASPTRSTRGASRDGADRGAARRARS